MSDHDPARTFQEDQAAARTEEETREAAQWELAVRNTEAQAMDQEAHAALLWAKARTWRSAGSAIGFLTLAAIVLTVLSFFGVGAW